MANIKKGDLVQVISGPSQARGGDRGKQGKVIEVLKAEGSRGRGGCQLRHQARPCRPDAARHQDRRHRDARGSHPRLERRSSIDPKSKKPTRVGFREEQVTKDGVTKTVRVRYAKKSGEDL